MRDNTPPRTTDLPPLLLEKVAIGELDEDSVLERFDITPETLRARLDALRRDNDAILAEHPAREMAEAIYARLQRDRAEAQATVLPFYRRSSTLAIGGALAAAAALMLVIYTPAIQPAAERGGPPEATTLEPTRLKGEGPSVQIWRDGDPPSRLKDGASARAGDTLQIKYLPRGAAYGAIASIDGRGSVTLHYPATAQAPTALERGPTALKYGYQLDDAPAFERFYFITSSAPIDIDSLLDELHQIAQGDLSNPEALPTPRHDADAEVDALTLRKE